MLRLGRLLSWSIAIALFGATLARLVAHDAAWPLLVFNQFAAWILPLAWVPLLVAARRRAVPLALVAAPPALWHLWIVGTTLVPRTAPPACGPAFSLISANLLMVHPDPGPLAQEVFDADADIVLLQELSPHWRAALETLGFYEAWPEGWEVVREDSFGSAIQSRLPLDTYGEWQLTGLPQTRATFTWEGRTITLLNVHTLPPRTAEYAAYHREALAQVADELRERAARGESFVLAGDLNSGPESRFFADVAGVADDAWALTRAGFGFTWPNGVFPLPPSRIDHVVVSRDLTVTDIRVGVGMGSDHRPLRVDVAPRCR
jgi:endonuclease/exonuclease/phosphatase (EEP) superfamily protein YafD